MVPIVEMGSVEHYDNGYNGPPYLDNTSTCSHRSDQMKSNKNFQIFARTGPGYQIYQMCLRGGTLVTMSTGRASDPHRYQTRM